MDNGRVLPSSFAISLPLEHFLLVIYSPFKLNQYAVIFNFCLLLHRFIYYHAFDIYCFNSESINAFQTFHQNWSICYRVLKNTPYQLLPIQSFRFPSTILCSIAEN
jgi:hypothetical protein